MNYYIKQVLHKSVPKDLEKEIIKYFGEEKLKEIKVAEELQQFVNKVCMEYLLIEPIPVVFDHTIKSTASYHIDLDAIILHPKNIDDRNRLLVSVAHELKHAHQFYYVNYVNTPQSLRWAKEIETYTTNPEHYYDQEIEIDAIAFSQIVMLEEFGVKVESYDKELQNKVDTYKLNQLKKQVE